MIARLRRIAPLLLLAVAGWVGVQLLQEFSSSRISREMAAQAKVGDIMMISSENCPYCKQARAWFTQNQVVFGECFIERDAACAEVYRVLQAPGTPTLVVRGQRQVGFSPERVMQALRQGRPADAKT